MPTDLTPILKSLLLQILSAYEQITALRLALESTGILTAEVKASAMERSEAQWRERRQSIERIGATQDALLQQLLKDFEGPVQ